MISGAYQLKWSILWPGAFVSARNWWEVESDRGWEASEPVSPVAPNSPQLYCNHHPSKSKYKTCLKANIGTKHKANLVVMLRYTDT